MWQFVFWLCLGIIAYTYLGYPLLLFGIGKFRRRRHTASGGTDYPTVCLIISAFNEEKVIREKIENSLGLDYPQDRLTVLVASDGSDDGTVATAEAYVSQGVRLFHHAQRTGKSAVINEVMGDIEEDVVVFTDANSLFAKDALTTLVRHFEDPAIGCVVGKLRYVDRHTTSVGRGESVYWRYEALLSELESSLQSVLVANGSIFGIRRELFRELYPEVANDFQLPIEIASQGFGVIYEPEALALERSALYWQEEFRRKVRIVLRGLTGFAKMRDKFTGFRRWQFVSHKLLRWLVGPLLFVALLSNAMLAEGSVFYTTLVALQAAFCAAAVNGWRVRKTRRPHALFYLPFYFTMVNLAAVMAIAKFISGDRQTVWEKAESARFAPVRTAGPGAAAGPTFEKTAVLGGDSIHRTGTPERAIKQ